MPRERKPNEARVRYDRDELIEVLTEQGMLAGYAEAAANLYERRRAAGKDMPCQSVVHHGPGHQGTTYCQVQGGDAGHDHLNEDGHYDPAAPPTHYARLPSGGTAEWTDDNPFAEYWG
jgi:hypothetical protein